MPILLSVLLFVLSHLPEIIKVVKAIFAFISAHRKHPQFKSWVKEFADLTEEAKVTRDPKPLEDFLARIRSQVAG